MIRTIQPAFPAPDRSRRWKMSAKIWMKHPDRHEPEEEDQHRPQPLTEIHVVPLLSSSGRETVGYNHVGTPAANRQRPPCGRDAHLAEPEPSLHDDVPAVRRQRPDTATLRAITTIDHTG